MAKKLHGYSCIPERPDLKGLDQGVVMGSLILGAVGLLISLAAMSSAKGGYDGTQYPLRTDIKPKVKNNPSHLRFRPKVFLQPIPF